MKMAVIINAERLTPELDQLLHSSQLKEKFHIDYDTYITEAKNIEQLLLSIRSQSYQAYLIGGGDGTVRSAVQALVDCDVPLAILPLGTFNLLAKALQYPSDVEKMFAIIKNNKTKLIDLTVVNNNIVINHAWIGFYYYILKLRKKYKAVLGKSRLLKSIFNTLTLFKTLPIYTLEVDAKGEKVKYKTCLAYIGNNEFYNDLFEMGERKTLSSGLMSVTILNAQTRWQLFFCMLSLIFDSTKTSTFVTYFCTDNMTITTKRPIINTVIDGELFKLESPLTFQNYQKKLKVFVP